MTFNQLIKSIFWKIESDESKVLHRVSIKPFEYQPCQFDDDRVNQALKHHNEKWFHNEIVVKVENATVEPQYAYAVNGMRTIIEGSIRTTDVIPSPIPMIKAKLLGKKRTLKKAILFDGTMGVNYTHFLSDVLHKIYLLESYTKLDCPILVGTAVFNKSMVQFIMQHSELSTLNWQMITEPVEVEELYIARPMPYRAEYWQRTKRLFIKLDHQSGTRKALFVNRSGTRCITNFPEIKDILNRHGVEIIAPEKYNMAEQAELYNSATHIIGIHGAGMTNVAFCKFDSTKVLELCSNNRIGTQFYWLCTALGINWDMMLGSVANPDQSFELDPVKFEEKLIVFLVN